MSWYSWFFERLVPAAQREQLVTQIKARATAEIDQAKAMLAAETSGILAARQAHARHILIDADMEATSIRKAARETAQADIATAVAKIQRTWRVKAEEELNRRVAAAVKKGQEEGYEQGYQAGYQAAAVELGLEGLPPEIPLTPLRGFGQFDCDRVYPNIYSVPQAWAVRAVVDGQRHDLLFPYNLRHGVDAKVMALVRAIKARDRLRPAGLHNAALFTECMQRAGAVLGGTSLDEFVIAAEMFHFAVQRVDGDINRVGMIGDDPQDRFPDADLQVLTEPWSVLFTKVPDAVAKALFRLGLDNRRTVRDLLLLTANELANQNGIGPATLQRVRSGLAKLGLALWGDVVQAPPTPNRLAAPERVFRAIDLD